jgi:hypothetical protein
MIFFINFFSASSLALQLGYIHPLSIIWDIFIPGPTAEIKYNLLWPFQLGYIGPSAGIYSSPVPQLRYIHP